MLCFVFQLKNIKWLWVSLDDEVKNSLEEIKRINESLMKGERLERHNYKTVIPFLQPLLEIMSGTDSCYMNGQSFVTEIESLWLWLDRARHWCLDADELCKTARAKFKHADDSLVDLSFLNRLVSNTLSHDDRQQLLHDMIQKVIDDCS
ncbi:hypothetical protein DICVIV_07290 [Dictyocaulus viviparus]|uniref:Uncharacterized protein n=1 Tax=Dictyocaulus viviparus TaxID=29172 RepID=A0A0D8XWA1_DICVI|nr:hypothetical protein DICVIV_07290 [Dictyocaulus viviparus]